MLTMLVDDRGASGEYAHFLEAHQEHLPALELEVLSNWRELEPRLAASTPDLILLDMRFDTGSAEGLAGDLDALAQSARFGGDRQRAEAQLRKMQGVFLLQALRGAGFAGPVILFGSLPSSQAARLVQRYSPLRLVEGLLYEGVRKSLEWAAQHLVT